jgi:hypothetical protein
MPRILFTDSAMHPFFFFHCLLCQKISLPIQQCFTLWEPS